jgi:hypothetical protein
LLVMIGAATKPWGAAGWYPDRVASLTVLSTPHPVAFLKSLWTSKQGLLSWYMGLFQVPVLPESVARRTFAKSLRDSGVPDEFIDRYAAAMAEPGAHRRPELVSRHPLLHAAARGPDHGADHIHLGPA